MKLLQISLLTLLLTFCFACGNDDSKISDVEVNAPEINPPDINPPDIDPPDINPPKITPPKIAQPEIDPPKIKFPDIDAPDIDMPEIDYRGMKTFERDGYVVYAIQAEVLFDFDKSNIRPDARRSLEQIATSIGKRYEGQPVQVHGHTDSKGSNNYNQTLSKERATTVADWLNNQGSIEGNIAKKWHGETQPVAANQLEDGSDNPGGRQQNRRVEIWVKKA